MGPRVPFAPSLLTLSLHITLHIYFISSWLFILLYVTCVMVSKVVKKTSLLLRTTIGSLCPATQQTIKTVLIISILIWMKIRFKPLFGRLRHGSHCRLFLFLLCHKLSLPPPPKYVGTFTLQGSKGSHVCNLGDIRYKSANYLSFHARKKHQTIMLAMRLVLILLATCQSLFNFLNLQINLIGLSAFDNI